jgi:two-component system response regulator HydG
VGANRRDIASQRVLVVDDDVEMAAMLQRKLVREGYDVDVCHDPTDAIARAAKGGRDWDVVILDVGLPKLNGIDVLKALRTGGSLASIIMLSGDASATTATAAMRSGAFHYLTKPFEPRDLSIVVESAARYAMVRRRLVEKPGQPGRDTSLIGTSPPLRQLAAAIAQIGSADVSVLLQGESGTGKELVARALHAASRRSARPFVAVNCSAIPEQLIDSELFGHARGAFTGAMKEHPGMFAEADGGTLFLDEIGDMPLPVQARLLRALQESEIRPVGSDGVRKVDVRVIAATHVDLDKAVAERRFRQDLYYRLRVVTLELPPLRDRPEDVPVLAAHFLRKHCPTSPPAMSPDALDALAGFAWPGNVRELENAMLHAIAFQQDGMIGLEALPKHLWLGAAGTAPLPRVAQPITDDEPLLPLTEAKRRSTAMFERAYLVKVLERGHGSLSEAARIAGVDRTNLRRLLKRHEIDPEAFRSKTR